MEGERVAASAAYDQLRMHARDEAQIAAAYWHGLVDDGGVPRPLAAVAFLLYVRTGLERRHGDG